MLLNIAAVSCVFNSRTTNRAHFLAWCYQRVYRGSKNMLFPVEETQSCHVSSVSHVSLSGGISLYCCETEIKCLFILTSPFPGTRNYCTQLFYSFEKKSALISYLLLNRNDIRRNEWAWGRVFHQNQPVRYTDRLTDTFWSWHLFEIHLQWDITLFPYNFCIFFGWFWSLASYEFFPIIMCDVIIPSPFPWTIFCTTYQLKPRRI